MSEFSPGLPAEFAEIGLAVMADPAYADRLVAALKRFANDVPEAASGEPTDVAPVCEAA